MFMELREVHETQRRSRNSETLTKLRDATELRDVTKLQGVGKLPDLHLSSRPVFLTW